MTETIGRRERKKAATRQAIADTALRLFLERGYDQVSVREIADTADVSTATLFKHFPSKEALVFDMDADHEAALVAVVRDRPAGQSIVTALREHVRGRRKRATDAELRQFLELVNSTPALNEYIQRMWMRHETALARAITQDRGVPEDDPMCAALAHFALAADAFARESADPEQAVDRAFDLLEHGWDAV
jgi:AcrR family transcriptional regulator